MISITELVAVLVAGELEPAPSTAVTDTVSVLPTAAGLVKVPEALDRRRQAPGLSIAGRGFAHRAQTAALVATLGGNLRRFFLPPYSPGRNPGEPVGKHRNPETAGGLAAAGQDGFRRKVRSPMRQRQDGPGKIRSFYRKPALKYAA